MGWCRSVLWVFVDWCRFVEHGWVGLLGFCVLEVVVVVGIVGLLGFFFFFLVVVVVVTMCGGGVVVV